MSNSGRVPREIVATHVASAHQTCQAIAWTYAYLYCSENGRCHCIRTSLQFWRIFATDCRPGPGALDWLECTERPRFPRPMRRTSKPCRRRRTPRRQRPMRRNSIPRRRRKTPHAGAREFQKAPSTSVCTSPGVMILNILSIQPVLNLKWLFSDNPSGQQAQFHYVASSS